MDYIYPVTMNPTQGKININQNEIYHTFYPVTNMCMNKNVYSSKGQNCKSITFMQIIKEYVLVCV